MDRLIFNKLRNRINELLQTDVKIVTIVRRKVETMVASSLGTAPCL